MLSVNYLISSQSCEQVASKKYILNIILRVYVYQKRLFDKYIFEPKWKNSAKVTLFNSEYISQEISNYGVAMRNRSRAIFRYLYDKAISFSNSRLREENWKSGWRGRDRERQ